jgi:kynureninase
VEDRFVMDPTFIAEDGAYGFRLSNPPVLLIACVRASLDMFEKAGGMSALRQNSLLLTGYLEHLLKTEIDAGDINIFTPSDPNQRGCQLSLSFSMDVEQVFNQLGKVGIICDFRKPNVVRIAPAPLYNNAHDVLKFVSALKKILAELKAK